ncbi:M14 family zinc carboxypeptidase [Lutibacter sp.]|uniref:M14 family zinc carboxypeptidase n=1 Tax=Lutibacter sp. TaxID=1925666 RepID=UPI001A1D15E0|nr:M14 family zinc carboxypeptidase [Lutibacter sp.]MBI9040831.1 T9SS type A sorting domain-containing protein [Lutibacter sp.]
MNFNKLKSKIVFIVIFLNSFVLFSQNENLDHTHSKKIRINNPTSAVLLKVQEAGIDLRCGAFFEDNTLFMELNSSEIESLNKAKVQYIIEIEDLAKFTSERVAIDLPIAKAQLEVEKNKKKLGIKSTNNEKSSASITSVIVDNYLQYAGLNEVDWMTPTNFNLGSMGGCLTFSEMKAELDQMYTYSQTNGLNIVSQKANASSSGQKTWGNPSGTITNPQNNGPATYTGQGNTRWDPETIWYVRITGNQSGTPENTKPQMLFTSMIHSREVSALMNNIYFMWYLIENYNTNPAIKELVDNNELYFVPVVNPDGLRWNEHIDSVADGLVDDGGGMQRKNLRPLTGGTGNTSVDRGVDLNRNFDYFWGYNNIGSSGTQTASNYRGPSRASEPETQIMVNFILNRNFKTSVWNHSYANSVPHPYGGIPTKKSGREDEFYRWHEEMTRYNRYLYGATIFYESNGLPDDWMAGSYDNGIDPPVADLNGSFGSGQGILGTTPEHGSSGFWPAPSLIVPIAKQSMRISFGTAYYGGKYAKLHDLTQSNITSITSGLNFGIERIGQTGSDFTVTVTPISSNINSISSPATEIGMNVLEQRTVTATLELNPAITANEKIEYNVKLSNDNGIIYEANFEKYYQPTVLFNHIPDTNGLTGWTQSGGWINSTADAYSNTNSLSTGTYSNNATKTLTTTNSYDFSNSTEVLVQFYSKWDIERNYDFVEVLGSPDGGTNWISLKGKYTKPEATSATTSHDNKSATYANFQANSKGQIYDGDRMDNWVMEEIVIDDTYSTLLNSSTAKIRFNFRTDALNVSENYSTTSDGFFIDDFKIIKVVEPCVLSVPTNVSVIAITADSATASWDNIPSATYDLRYRVFGASSWIDVNSLVSANYNFNSLSVSTQYEVQVRAKCATNSSSYSSSLTFTTLAANYCPSQGNSIAFEYISNVQLNSVNNNSQSTTSLGYSDYTSSVIFPNLDLNSINNTISVTKYWPNGIYSEAVVVWIDYNKNGTFESSEIVLNTASNTNTPVSNTFTVPGTATLGNTRMRVSMKYNAAPSSCEIFAEGEVEDYTVNIIDSTLGIEDEILSTFSIYPNPVSTGEITIKMPNEIHDFDITVSNVLGQKVYAKKVQNNFDNTELVNTTNFMSGIYFITVSTQLGKATKKLIIN